MQTKKHNLLVILGPTACGKTHLGVALAQRLRAEIISADSRQVYRDLDIGTGKDLHEYGSGSEAVPYHLIDIVEVQDRYSVYDFQLDFYRIFESLQTQQTIPILVGGTGLYLEAVLENYQMPEAPIDHALRSELATLSHLELQQRLKNLSPRLHNTTDLTRRENTIRAIEIATAQQESNQPNPAPILRPLILGTRFSRHEVYQRIEKRLKARIPGMLAEVSELISQGVDKNRLRDLGLEYKFVTAFLDHEIESQELLEQQLARAIRNFAKRQLSWFRRMERRGHTIHWIDQADSDLAWQVVKKKF